MPPMKLIPRIELTRRQALKSFAAALAAWQVGCLEHAGEDELRPAVRRPELAPGTPRMFATSFVLDGYGTGLHATTYDGRPTKLDGNPAHPTSLGGSLAQHQAAIVELYDPYRLRLPQRDGAPATWTAFLAAAAARTGELWLVLPPDASPLLAAQLARVPGAHVVRHTALPRDNAHDGTALPFGMRLEQQLAFARAGAVVALDADSLAPMPMATRWAHDFAPRRRDVEAGHDPLRLFVAEPM